MRQYIQKYDRPDNLIIISLYPKRGELYSAGTSGVASYTKNIAKNMNRNIIVLADYEEKKEMYEEGKILVYRCFQRNTPKMWIEIIKALLKFSSIKTVLVQLDFAIYGSTLTTSLVLPLLAVLKLFGYQVSVTMHHVVLDAFKLKGHVGIKEGIIGQIKGWLYNILFHGFYFLLGTFTHQVIVLEEVLKTHLSKVIASRKITTISHGVDTHLHPISKLEARKKLKISKNEYVILFFGFINWFKGADCFVDAYKDTEYCLGRKARFIIAGGESPTLKDRKYYQEYFNHVITNVKAAKQFEITGYVPQKKIAQYFSAADLVVLPYRTLMTASGVLSLVFSYRKPFIISDELGKMFQSPDFKYALKKTGLHLSDVVFKLNHRSALVSSENVLKNGIKKKMSQMAGIMSELRSYENTAGLYEKALSSWHTSGIEQYVQ